ncbi:MAG: MBL fold metallo-hydrolase [Candidatus Methanospirareceae archaeon]
MKIKFFGGCNEVGRSAILIDDQILLDYGIRPSDPPEVPEMLHVMPRSVIISHAHLDHSGMVPSLMSMSTRMHTSVYATSVTRELTNLLGKDTIKIGREEGYSLFSEEDLKKLEICFKTVSYGEEYVLNGANGADYEFMLFNAGHIPGSASVYLRNNKEDISIFYTGDIKTEETRLLRKADMNLPKADILIIESTYYGREHGNRKELEKEFVDSIEETLDAGGNAIVPCFAVGRTQEIVMILHSYGLTPYVDGMGLGVLRLIKKYPSFLKDAEALKEAFKEAHFVNPKKRKKVLSKPSVVVTTAGMLNGGPVLYYLSKIHDDPKSKVLLTGYQIEGTNGRRLLEEGCVDTENGILKIKGKVEKYDFSAHAGDSGLKKIVSRFCKNGTSVVFAVHGDRTKEFAEWIGEKYGCNAIAPSNGEEYIIE